ncbi:MAG: DUF72 domain-containing protein [Sutterellaceae bacterium]|nr:DUF72 domain-containing protein [Burkholderiaceae bacterium]MDW8430828.1 DUF72 domain-containing protein [Sutterellaceae bacterium]
MKESRRAAADSDDFFAAPTAASMIVAARADEALLRLARQLPDHVYLGTSSWSFPGWRGLVYGGDYSEAQLARAGLAAYAAHPLLRAVGLDRGFYQPLPQAAYAHYARQVPVHFRFVVKAPSLVTDAVRRGAGGQPTATNPHFLDARVAAELFVQPALAGLAATAGALVFQLSPLPRELLRPPASHRLIEQIGAFFAELPRAVAAATPVYALEVRDAALLTPRLVRTLRQAGARLVVAVHPRLPHAARQATALRALDAAEDASNTWRLRGPLVVRWNLRAGLRYEEAKRRFAPFDRLQAPDLVTRGTLVHLIHVAIASAQPAYVIVNNKAEGCGPVSCIELARAVVANC